MDTIHRTPSVRLIDPPAAAPLQACQRCGRASANCLPSVIEDAEGRRVTEVWCSRCVSWFGPCVVTEDDGACWPQE